MKPKRFWFRSSRAVDNCPGLCISTTTKVRAIALAAKYFTLNGFKGEPKLLAV